MSQFVRTEMLIGVQNVEKLKNASVLVCGVGGVGGFCVEALGRSGVGKIGLVDNDTVNESNINRQIVALHSTIGRKKTEVMRERLLEINPKIVVKCYDIFILKDNIGEAQIGEYDYIVDCVDTVTAKIAIIEKAKELGKYVISSMGTGNKLDPSKFSIADISKTSVCPLASVMRRELKKRGIKDVPALFSTELPIKGDVEQSSNITVILDETAENSSNLGEKLGENADKNGQSERKKRSPSSISFVPSIAGLLIAGEVIRTIIK